MKELWTEWIFNRLPIKRDDIKQQILVRTAFLFLIWDLGILAYAMDGMLISYVYNLQFSSSFLGSGFIVLIGAYLTQRALPDVVASFRPLVKLDDVAFMRFSDRIQRYSRGFMPILAISFVFIIWYTKVPEELLRIWTAGISLHSIYFIFVTFFGQLLVATGIWLGVSIWLAIFMVSRQPLDVKLSSDTVGKFRGLSMLALWFSLFYFIAISLGGGLSIIGSSQNVLLSPFFLFIAIGVISIMFPFYNIHLALLSLKRRQSQEVEEEFQVLRQRLDGATENEEILKIMARLMSLQIREKYIHSAAEWPIDIGFLSKLLSVISIPTIIKLAIELL